MPATNPSEPSFSAPEIPELAILRAGVEWAKAQRIRVEPAAPPVECASAHGNVRWVRRGPDAIVDPIGAAILRRQPQALHLVDAAKETLFSSIPAVEGLADGLSGEPPSPAWVRSVAKGMYLPAYLAGVQLRCELSSWVCHAHKLRVARGERCPVCVRGLS
jgi:hypothetical protein